MKMLKWIEDDLEKQFVRRLKIKFLLTSFSLHLFATLLISWFVHYLLYRNPFRLTDTIILYRIDESLIFGIFVIITMYAIILTLNYAMFLDINIRFRKGSPLYIERSETEESIKNNNKKEVDYNNV